MASNGLVNRAERGKCRICQRVRNTDMHLKAVGEVRHGFAVGHVWECTDIEECEKFARERLKDESCHFKWKIEQALEKGRFGDEYKVFT